MYALVGGTVHTATAEGTFEGTVVFDEDGIVALGDVEPPAEATVVDVEGHHVTPGLVDAHSHAGMAEWGEPEDADINEGTDAVTPQVSALDGFHPRDEELRHARRDDRLRADGLGQRDRRDHLLDEDVRPHGR